MSKASALGAGRFGSSTAAPVSARRQAVAAATSVPTEGIAPPNLLPVDRVSLNPDNPRSALGDLTELAGSLKEHGQKQAITVMNRDAYIKANPERETELDPDATHVVIDGSSRLAAAREACLTHVKVSVDDDQGSDPEALLESALVANIHRQDLAELDEARALQRLLAIHGSQSSLAKRLHKSQGWVSQRLALLNLTPELQERIGQEPIKFLRAVGNKPADQQEAALEQLKEQAARKEAPRLEVAPAPAEPARDDREDREDREEAVGHYPVIAPAPAPATRAVDTAPVPVEKPEPQQEQDSGLADSIPEPRDATPVTETADKPPRFPYDDGVFAAQHLIHKMTDGEFDKMMTVLDEHRDRRSTNTD